MLTVFIPSAKRFLHSFNLSHATVKGRGPGGPKGKSLKESQECFTVYTVSDLVRS